MSTSGRRLAAVAAAGTVGLLATVPFALTTDGKRPASPPAATQNVIVVPGPEQVTGTIDPTDMDWLSRYVAGSATTWR
ncbi:hypothetical protein ABH926_004847 [Catenulispora sp. GP43]|uniref:hypothetical protein n=1 Tax=Catenulispora sp. GP43 TaxID=3156263 RepID=UPI003511CBA6